MGDSGGEEYLTCPYDKLHKIRPMRIQNHVLKCRKKYPDQKMISCKWNEYHLVFEMELRHHEDSCTDRNPPALQAQAAGPVAPPEISARNKQHRIDAEGGEDEDWGPELNSKEIAEGSQCFVYPRCPADGLLLGYQPKLMSRTEKIDWRIQQRRKFQHRLETDPVFAGKYMTEPPEELLYSPAPSEGSISSGGFGGGAVNGNVNNGNVDFNDGQSSLGDEVSASAFKLHPILEEDAESDHYHNNAQGEDSHGPEPTIKIEGKIDAIRETEVAQETDGPGTGTGLIDTETNKNESEDEEEDDEFFDAQSEIVLEDLAFDLTNFLTFP